MDKVCGNCAAFDARDQRCHYNPPAAFGCIMPATNGSGIAKPGAVPIEFRVFGEFPPVDPKKNWCTYFVQHPDVVAKG